MALLRRVGKIACCARFGGHGACAILPTLRCFAYLGPAPSILRLVDAFGRMNVAIDDLQIGKSPECEQRRPGTVALLAPDPEQRHAMVDLSGLPQPLAGAGATP